MAKRTTFWQPSFFTSYSTFNCPFSLYIVLGMLNLLSYTVISTHLTCYRGKSKHDCEILRTPLNNNIRRHLQCLVYACADQSEAWWEDPVVRPFLYNQPFYLHPNTPHWNKIILKQMLIYYITWVRWKKFKMLSRWMGRWVGDLSPPTMETYA